MNARYSDQQRRGTTKKNNEKGLCVICLFVLADDFEKQRSQQFFEGEGVKARATLARPYLVGRSAPIILHHLAVRKTPYALHLESNCVFRALFAQTRYGDLKDLGMYHRISLIDKLN